MIICFMICITVVFCVVYILHWARNMAQDNLPMFTWGECVYKEEQPTTTETHPLGFVVDETHDEEKKPTDGEIKEQQLADPVMLCAALIRGEVDIDELTRK